VRAIQTKRMARIAFDQSALAILARVWML
jgi:hypothetical protein